MRTGIVGLLTWLLVTAMLVAVTETAGGRSVTVDRLSGAGRVETALALSEATHPDGSVDTAVVAAAGTFADALAAAPLAVAVGGPVLLNPEASLDDGVRAELQRLGVDHVFLMGGTLAQSDAVQRQIDRLTGVTVQRLGGSTRYGTARMAAREAVEAWRAAGDAAAGSHVLVALGDHASDPARAWPDALVAGVLAGHAHRPILLTLRDRVPEETQQALADLGTTTTTVIGGRAAIPDSTQAQLGGEGTARHRLGGATRYHTAALVADAAIAEGASATQVVVATGQAFPDALAAAPVAVARGGVLILVGTVDLDASTGGGDWLRSRRGAVDRATVAGGPLAVAEPVLGQIRWAIEGWSAPTLRLEPVIRPGGTPLGVVAAPGDARPYVFTRAGVIRILDGGANPTFLDVSGRLRTDGERGLLGVAFHPGHADNGRLFLHYSRRSDGATILEEYRRSGRNSADAASGDVLMSVGQPAGNHNGGSLVFAPDGTLHLFLGDGGGAGDPSGHGQNPGTKLGAQLRIDVSTPGVAHVAAGNPFAGGGGDPFVWAYGLRNPFRSAFDPLTNRVYVADVGQSQWEEVNVQPATTGGLNYGWNRMEGGHCFNSSTCDERGLTLPAYEYSHGSGRCSVTGGEVYRGRLGMLRGHYFFGDFCAGTVESFRFVDGDVTERTDWTATLGLGNVYSFGRDAVGELYVMDASRVYRIVPG